MSDLNNLFDLFQQQPKFLAKFLHTLSLLEYIGTRKIIKSQHESEVSMEILLHASEEIRHARVFKKLAEEVGQKSLGGYVSEDLLCMAEAEAYFQTVDSEVGRCVSDRRVAYALTTLLVEERALEIYPPLEDLLSSLGFSGRVAGILKEEENHLRAIHQELVDVESLLVRCQEVERTAFSKFIIAVGAVASSVG